MELSEESVENGRDTSKPGTLPLLESGALSREQTELLYQRDSTTQGLQMMGLLFEAPHHPHVHSWVGGRNQWADLGCEVT